MLGTIENATSVATVASMAGSAHRSTNSPTAMNGKPDTGCALVAASSVSVPRPISSTPHTRWTRLSRRTPVRRLGSVLESVLGMGRVYDILARNRTHPGRNPHHGSH